MGTGSGRICFGRILRFEGDRCALGEVWRLFIALPLEKPSRMCYTIEKYE